MKFKVVSWTMLTLLLVIPFLYAILVPSIVALEIEEIGVMTTFAPLILSDLEKLDTTVSMEGKAGGKTPGGVPYWFPKAFGYGVFEFPILIKVHMYAEEVKGDNVILKVETNVTRADTIRLQNETAINMSNPVCTKWNAISEPDVNVPLRKYHILSWKDIDKDGELSSSDRIHMDMTHPVLKRWCDVQDVEYGAICYVDITNMSIPDFSGNSTYVFNKLTRKNVQDAPEASKNRTGYDPLYPSHLKPGEPIHDVWLDNLNTTGTLEFVKTVQIEDVELYEYFLNKTFTKELIIPDVSKKLSNYTLTNTKNVLIEPLSGLPVYTINETVKIVKNFTDPKTGELYLTPIAYITYKDKGEIDLVTPRLAHGAMKVLEFDKVVKGWILGAIVVILTVAFIFNIGSLARARKMPPKAET